MSAAVVGRPELDFDEALAVELRRAGDGPGVLGIEVSLAGTQLACRPGGRLSPADRVLVLEHKPALIEYLARQRFTWEVFLLAESLGFPWIQIRPGVAVAGDRAGWATFLCEPPEPSDLVRAYVAVLGGEGLAR